MKGSACIEHGGISSISAYIVPGGKGSAKREHNTWAGSKHGLLLLHYCCYSLPEYTLENIASERGVNWFFIDFNELINCSRRWFQLRDGITSLERWFLMWIFYSISRLYGITVCCKVDGSKRGIEMISTRKMEIVDGQRVKSLMARMHSPELWAVDTVDEYIYMYIFGDGRWRRGTGREEWSINPA